MIKILKHSQIDFEKYQYCLRNGTQYKYSAESSFLDIVTRTQWDLVVYQDYKAIMPVPYIRKLGMKIVVNPKLCQQLGVFSDKDCKEINDQMLYFLLSKYNVWKYTFNSSNTFSNPLSKKKNYFLSSDSYDVVSSNYSPKRKRKLRLAPEVKNKTNVTTNIAVSEAEEFIRSHMMGTRNADDLEDYINIFLTFYQSGHLFFYGFYYENKLINLLAIYKNDRTAVLLGSFNNKEFAKIGGSSILVDRAIKDHISDHIFDFEGSEIAAVEEFFRGFRPATEYYSVLYHSKSEIFKRIFWK